MQTEPLAQQAHNFPFLTVGKLGGERKKTQELRVDKLLPKVQHDSFAEQVIVTSVRQAGTVSA